MLVPSAHLQDYQAYKTVSAHLQMTVQLHPPSFIWSAGPPFEFASHSSDTWGCDHDYINIHIHQTSEVLGNTVKVYTVR